VSKRVLSLDVGVTTGYAVHTLDGKLLAHGDFDISMLREGVKNLRDLHMVSYAVAERPVIIRGPLGDKLQEAMNIVSHELMHAVDFVDPAQWKPTPWGKAPTPRKLSPHQRDAIRLGLWYIASLQKRLQGR
jgi:hypothetical protein